MGKNELDEVEIIKSHALMTLRHLEGERNFIYSLRSSMANWIMATIFAMNGAGALTSINAIKDYNLSEYPAFIFAFGVVFSFLYGFFLDISINQISDYIEKITRHFSRLAESGIENDKSKIRLISEAKRGIRFGWISNSFQWLSIASFLAGSLYLGLQFSKSNASDLRRCEALEKDILASQPKRVDSLEIFKAFGCKTATQLSVQARPYSLR